jgi:hypothetical protein
VIAAAYGGADAHQILHAVPPLADVVSGSLVRTLTSRKTGEFTGNSRMKMTVSMNPAAGNA